MKSGIPAAATICKQWPWLKHVFDPPTSEVGLTLRSYLMSTTNGSRVLAIGIDAAEATFVKQLIELGEMPALRSLLEGGRWLTVQSPANIGSGAVRRTFRPGHEPPSHRIGS